MKNFIIKFTVLAIISIAIFISIRTLDVYLGKPSDDNRLAYCIIYLVPSFTLGWYISDLASWLDNKLNKNKNENLQK